MAPQRDVFAEFVLEFFAKPLGALRPPMFGVHDFGELRGLVLHRQKPFQVELFIVGPDSKPIPSHSHPGVESIVVVLSGEIEFAIRGTPEADMRLVTGVSSDGAALQCGSWVRIPPGASHHGSIGARGGSFLTFTHWLNGEEPSSVGLEWEGEPHMAEHKAQYK